MVHVVLQLVIHPARVLHFVGPVIGVEFCPRKTILVGSIAIVAVKLIVPNQRVSVGSIVGWLLCCRLRHADGLACYARHDGDGTRAGTGRRISRNRDRQRARLGYRILSFDSDEFLISVYAPFLACGAYVDGITTALNRHSDIGLRQRDTDRCRLWVFVVAPTAAPKGYGKREQKCIKHESFHITLIIEYDAP